MKRKTVTLSLVVLLLFVFLISTNPTSVPSFFLVVPFMLMFVCLFLATVSYLEQLGFSRRRRLRMSVLCAGLPCVLLVLQSIDQLTARDVLAVVGFFGLLFFYVIYASETSGGQ